MVDTACSSLGVDRKNIECVAFSAGPGSFTGVRIGAAAAQGIAMGIDAQICAIPTSAAMAERVSRSLTSSLEFRVTRLSRAQLVYEAYFHFDGKTCACTKQDQLVERSGDCADDSVFTENDIALSAQDVLMLAAREDAVWQSPSQALPIYVDGDHPWRSKT